MSINKGACLHLEVAADEADEARALHAPKRLHLLQQLRPLVAVESAENFHRVQQSRLDVLREELWWRGVGRVVGEGTR